MPTLSNNEFELISTKLRETIAVIRVAANGSDRRFAGYSELPKGAEVDVCGEGFNERSVTVRWHGQLFFVYRQDLECPRNPFAD
jgi:hypothetical protein